MAGRPRNSHRELVASPTTQSVMGYLFAGFIFTLIVFAAQYLLLIGPMIARAQLLDDILLIAIEEKSLMGAPESGSSKALQPTVESGG